MSLRKSWSASVKTSRGASAAEMTPAFLDRKSALFEFAPLAIPREAKRFLPKRGPPLSSASGSPTSRPARQVSRPLSPTRVTARISVAHHHSADPQWLYALGVERIDGLEGPGANPERRGRPLGTKVRAWRRRRINCGMQSREE